MSSDSDDSSSAVSSPVARPKADDLGLDVSDDSDSGSEPPRRATVRQDSDSESSPRRPAHSEDDDNVVDNRRQQRALDSDDEEVAVRNKQKRRARVASSSSSGSSRHQNEEEDEPHTAQRRTSDNEREEASEEERDSPKRREEADRRSQKSGSDDDDERRSGSPRDLDQRDDNEDGQQDFQEEEIPETVMEADLPRIETDFGTEMHFVKLPNFLSVETRPFDEQQFEDEAPQDDVLDEEGRVRLKLKVENTIRWRIVTDEHGNEQRESNARIVRWSDGSLSLHLGDEVFDVHAMPLHDDFNHLFLKQGNGLEGLTVFRTKLTFRPHSTDSQTHKKVTLSMADRTARATQKVKMIPIVQGNPELAKQQLAKKEDELMRAQLKRENRQRVLRTRQRRSGLTQSLLEGDIDDEEGAVSISALKRDARARKNALVGSSQRAGRFSSDEEDAHSAYSDDDSDFGIGRARKKRNKMVLDQQDDGDDDE